MRKHLLCAALLAAGAACAQSEETTWNFSYQGFTDAATGVFNPDRQFGGVSPAATTMPTASSRWTN